ncbi:MAG: hypothetical protein ACJ76A_00190 [Actinomycetota bacterium]|jgi:hypothetical protein
MKIKGTCKRCGREFLFEQAAGSGGRCPWDGEPFNADYAVVLIQAMQIAEEAGTRLEQALEDIAAMRPAFSVDASSVHAKTQAAIAALGKNLITQG